MVPFGGWLMPLQYTGLVAEHLHTRSAASLFDLSHMGRLNITGPNARDLIQYATTNDIGRLAPGAAQYSLICNDRGGVIEDLLVYRLTAGWRLVVNASNRPRVVSRLDDLRRQRAFEATVRDETFDLALLGVQGPGSEEALQPLINGSLRSLAYYHALEYELMLGTGVPAYVARTGYTGEDGFELMVDSSLAPDLWERLVADERVEPAGLGARDTLRLEAGMALYGHELTEEVTPFEAGLGRVVRLEKGPFLGSDALTRLAKEPPRRNLVGLSFEPGAVPRAGCRVNADGAEIGEVASGTFSPTLRRPIATAYVSSGVAAPGTALSVTIRGGGTPATVVSLPFVPHRTKPQVSSPRSQV